MGIAYQHLPVLALELQLHLLQVGVVGGAPASIDEGTGVAWVVQDLQHPRVVQLAPQDLTLADAAGNAPREQDVLRAHAAQHGAG